MENERSSPVATGLNTDASNADNFSINEAECERLLQYLQKYKTICKLDARIDLSITNLGARIVELRELGFNIVTWYIDTIDLNGVMHKKMSHYGYYGINHIIAGGGL
jgi:hypothetical protein